MSEIEGLKFEIKSMKGTIINKLQDEMNKRVFSFTCHSTKIIIDAMVSQTKQTTEERVSKTEVLMNKVTEGPGGNVSNLM